MIGLDLDTETFAAALADKADALRQQLEDKIKANLSGAILQSRSGALLGSISSDIEDDGSGVTTTVTSADVPYAGILEYGGKTGAHDILPSKARALAFVAGGTQRFAGIVHHPGATIRAFAFMSSALDDLRDEIGAGLKAAVLGAIGADQ
jgi:phage gpG-like protein